MADAEYAALFDTLMQWIADGRKPAPAQIATRCAQTEKQFGGGCHFVPDFQPGPLFSRVAPR